MSDDAVSTVFTARTDGRKKSEEAKRLREVSFPENMLEGMGSEHWSTLWESARKFSEELAYPGQEFPVVEDGARCMLCQQGVGHEAGQRLKQFQSFVVSTTERELREIRGKFANLRKRFTDLRAIDETTEETIKEIRIEHEAIADAIVAALEENEKRRAEIVASLTNDSELPDDCPNLVSVADEADSLAKQFDERIKTLMTIIVANILLKQYRNTKLALFIIMFIEVKT